MLVYEKQDEEMLVEGLEGKFFISASLQYVCDY